MTPRHRIRLVVNLVNGSTVAGLGAALTGGATLVRGPDGLLTAAGYRPPLPPAAFTLGNVVIVNRRHQWPLPPAVLAHEARHATQYSWCGGLLMLPLYFTAAGASWVLCGNVAAWNVFERQAGLADGGYADVPLRPALEALRPALRAPARRLGMLSSMRASVRHRPAAGPGSRAAEPGPAGHDGSTAIPSR